MNTNNADQGLTLVVGADGSRSADYALMEALRNLSGLPGAELHLVHAAPPYTMHTSMEGTAIQSAAQYEAMLQEMPHRLRKRLSQLAETLRVPVPPGVHVHVRTGTATEMILDVAERTRAHLIIVGSHGRTGVSRLLLGSTAEAVVRRACCPVLVARRTQYEPLEDHAPEPPRSTPRGEPQKLPPHEKFSFHDRERVKWARGDETTAGV